MKKLLWSIGAVAVISLPLFSQDTESERLRQQRDELAKIRREREQLEKQHSALQNKVHKISEEVTLIDRQHNATLRAVQTLDKQLRYIDGEIVVTTNNLIRAQNEARNKRQALRARL